MMYHIPGVLSAQDVAWFREQLDAADWVDGRATTGAQGAQVKNNQQVNTQSERYSVLQQAVQTAVNNSALFFAAALPKTLSTPLFNRYQDNETYGFHVDGAVRSHPQNGWMRTDLSATLFLSNPDDYEGGELLVNDTYGQHAVKLPAGDLVIYPQLLENVKVKDKVAAREDEDVQKAAKEVTESLGDAGRLLLRESGTEPLIRVMVEAETDEMCRENVDKIVKVLHEKGHVPD